MVLRFNISWIMAFVAIAALDFGAMRLLFNSAFGLNAHLISVWGWGALLMANILAIGLLLGSMGRASRRFIWGFEIFGATTLALYVSGASFFPEELVIPLMDHIGRPLVEILRDGPYLYRSGYIVLNLVLAVVTALPQLAFALVGGFLFRNFRLTKQATE